MNLAIENKNALVCGGSKGIGKATAIELAKLGANVTLVSRSEESLKKAIQDLDTSLGQQHDYLSIDFSDVKNVEVGIKSYLDATKKNFHILINNTGGPAGGAIEKAGLDEFISAFNNHLLCNHALVQLLLEGMKTDSYGRVINIISTSVKAPLKGLGVSNTIRGAVANWAKTMANELGAYGITVNNVLPGATGTERLSAIIGNKAKKLNVSEDEAATQMKNIIPLGRFAKPEEVASAAAFLCTPAAAYINGINLPVDGGRTPAL
ncbi:MAG: SDR family oxidoreductase [Chitinophagales bacterium]